MDEQAVMSRISELENRVQELIQDRNNYAIMLVNYQAFVGKIPKYLPGHPDDEITANAWLDWAREKLGYETAK